MILLTSLYFLIKTKSMKKFNEDLLKETDDNYVDLTDQEVEHLKVGDEIKIIYRDRCIPTTLAKIVTVSNHDIWYDPVDKNAGRQFDKHLYKMNQSVVKQIQKKHERKTY